MTARKVLPISVFPWDRNEKPYFVNEEGWEWYLEEGMNEWIKSRSKHWGIDLKIVAFFVKKGKVINRILIDTNQQILTANTSMEAMAVYIDMLFAAEGMK